MNRQPITIHHRLPESWWGNLQPNNALHLRQNVHRALHIVFENATPIQRIRRSLEADKPVLSPDIYLALSNTLKRFEWIQEIESYDPKCFNSDKFIRQQKK